MVIQGKQYNKVNEKTVNGIVYLLYRSDEDKRGTGLDDTIVISHQEGVALDKHEISLVKKTKKSTHKESKVDAKDWNIIETLI